jgi:hypothetical protein
MSPHSANIDRVRIDYQYGGILARSQPVCARGMEFWKQTSNVAQDCASRDRLIRQHVPASVWQWNRLIGEAAGNKKS